MPKAHCLSGDLLWSIRAFRIPSNLFGFKKGLLEKLIIPGTLE